MYHNLCIHSSINGHLGCFHILATVKSAGMNVGVYASFSVMVSSGICPAVRLLGHQYSSVTQSCPTLCDPMNHSPPGLSVCYQLPEFTQTHVHWVSDAIQPCHPLPSPSPPAPNLSVFSHEPGLWFRWPKYWSFSFNISPSNEYPGLISFRMDWMDLLAVQGTLKSLLKHHSSKAPILLH